MANRYADEHGREAADYVLDSDGKSIKECMREPGPDDKTLFHRVSKFKREGADGGTIEEAASNAADVLTLVICEYPDEGIKLPGPTFHVPPRTIVCIDIDREAIERSKRLTYSQAAEELGISKARVCQLVKSHRLDARTLSGRSYVTIASVDERKANPPASHRPRRETPALGV